MKLTIKDFITTIRNINLELNANKGPKFKVGDVIVNDKFKVISKVHKLVLIEENLRDKNGQLTGARADSRTPHYILVDYENKAAQEHFNNRGIKLDKKTRKRYKQCVRIDSTYKLLDAKKANILFGDK